MRQEKDAPRITEKEFQAQVVELARLRGWLIFHPFDSRKSEPGFPDLVLVRPEGSGPGRVIYAELKREDGRLSNPQKLWLGALRSAGQEVFVWRPSDMDRVLEILK